MHYTIYEDIGKFKEDTFQLLLEKEAENNLMIRTVIHLETTSLKGSVLATVKDTYSQILAILTITTPLGLCLYVPPTSKKYEILHFVAKSLYEQGVIFQKAFGVEETIEAFSTFYGAYTRMLSKVSRSLNIYRLTHVQLKSEVSGYLRKATEQDLFYLPYWQQNTQTHYDMKTMCFKQALNTLQELIEKEALYIWEDQMPVAMVIKAGNLVHGIALSDVYTPPHLREKGYESASISALSKQLLDEGYAFIVLLVDETNKTSHSMYEAVGYERIEGIKELTFFKS